LGKNQCAFYKEKGHWNIDCLRLNNKKKESSEADVAMADDNDSDSSDFHFLPPLLFAIRGI